MVDLGWTWSNLRAAATDKDAGIMCLFDERRFCAAIEIQRLVRGFLARRQCHGEEMGLLVQKKIDDLAQVEHIVQHGRYILKIDDLQKTFSDLSFRKVFVVPSKVLLRLMRSASRLPPASHLQVYGRICARVASFVATALQAPLDSPHSLCRALIYSPWSTISSAELHGADPVRILCNFVMAVLEAGSATQDSACFWEAAAILDVSRWGLGSAMEEMQECREAVPQLMKTGTVRGRGLVLWMDAAKSAVNEWKADGKPPEALQALISVALAWLRLAEMDSVASGDEVLEGILSIPRMAGLLLWVQEQGSAGDALPWAALLRELKSRRRRAAAPAADSESEQCPLRVAYMACNLWELQTSMGLPLEPVLELQALLAESLDVRMLLEDDVHAEELPSNRFWRWRQLRRIADARSMELMFCNVFQMHPLPEFPAAATAYQRHCVAATLHKVNAALVRALCHLYSALLVSACSALDAEQASASMIFGVLVGPLARLESGALAPMLWRIVCASRLDLRSLNGCHELHLLLVVLSDRLATLCAQDCREAGAWPFNSHDLRHIVHTLTSMVSDIAWHGLELHGGSTSHRRMIRILFRRASRLLQQLWTINERWLPVRIEAASWQASSFCDFSGTVERLARGEVLEARALGLLHAAPQSVALDARLGLLRAAALQAKGVDEDRPPLSLEASATAALDDILLALGGDWHARILVCLRGAAGEESGEQPEGKAACFKELWQCLLRWFDPALGLFKATQDGLLYPNPLAPQRYPDWAGRLELLGLALGRAVLDGIGVQLLFAPAFLMQLAGRCCCFWDLERVNPGVFVQLQVLLQDESPALGFRFVATTEAGDEVELEQDGARRPVTSDNKRRFVELFSNYKLNSELAGAAAPVAAGLWRVLGKPYVCALDRRELQRLFAGVCHHSAEAPLDLEAWKEATLCQASPQASGTEESTEETVALFWEAVGALPANEQAKLLCRWTGNFGEPLLGFKHMDPVPMLRLEPVEPTVDAYPRATEVENTLVLPMFPDVQTMRQKLEHFLH